MTLTTSAASPTWDSRLALARLRAAGIHHAPTDATGVAALYAGANRAGRRLVDVSPADSLVQHVALGWQDGSEPVAGGDSGVTRMEASRELVLVLAAALRCCWHDRDRQPYPGEPTTVEMVLVARSRLDAHHFDPSSGGVGAQQHRRAALQRLRDTGYLSGDDTDLQLGHQVALWSQNQVRALQRAYDQLPAPPHGTADAASVHDEAGPR